MKATFRRYRPYFKDYKLQFVFVVIGIALTVSATAGLAQMMKYLTDDVLIAKDAQMLALMPFLIVGIYVAKSVGRYVQSVSMSYIGQHIIARLRETLLGKILGMEMGFLYSNRSGALISRVMSDIERVKYFVSNMLPEFLRDLLTVIVLAGYVIYLNPLLALFVLIVLPAMIYPLMKAAKRLKKYSHRSQEKNADVVTRLTEVFNNSEIIKANATEAYELNRFGTQNWQFFKINMKRSYISEAVAPVMEILASAGIAAVIYVGGRAVIEGDMTPGDLTAFISAVGMMLDPGRKLGAIYGKIQDPIAATERIFAVMDREVPIADGTKVLEDDISEVELENVTLAYSAETKALNGISLKVVRGEHVALVGDSGGGKSSLLNLLLRFYDPQEGVVRVNGVALPEYTQHSLRRHVAVVSQRVYIFQDTLAANVAYGQEIDEARVREALRLSDAEGFVSSLPEGIYTVMEEFGANLSGGQRQRIAIARAIYKGASLLLFDEATSALDNESEKRIQKALEAYTRGKLSVTVAHRLSTIEHADRIYVFKAGRIVASGSHADLLEHSEEYRRLAGELV